MFFLLCDYGDKVTNRFALLGDSYYNLLWYCLPVNQQKYIILSILNAKTPIYLEGSAIHSTREAFKKVRINIKLFSVEFKYTI